MQNKESNYNIMYPQRINCNNKHKMVKEIKDASQ